MGGKQQMVLCWPNLSVPFQNPNPMAVVVHAAIVEENLLKTSA